MDDEFKIFVEQLREGREQEIHEVFPPAFLGVQENDLKFEKPIELEGVAYLADDELILHWNVQTEASVACSICNEPVSVPIEVDDFYYSEPLAEIKSGIYNFKELLREIVLLEVPGFAECNEGNCPKRVEYNQYLREPSSQNDDEDKGYKPFANLDWGS